MRLLLIISFTITIATVFGQTPSRNELGYILSGIIIDGDTLPHSTLGQIVVIPPMVFKSNDDYIKYRKLIRDVKKVYPYAMLAKDIFGQVTVAMDTIEDKRDQKKFIKSKDQELQSRYTAELKKLTITQGKILIKLIDRETGYTSYDIVKELRGTVSAFMWQQMARMFGSSLKTGFDSEGEDKMINHIILMIENGML